MLLPNTRLYFLMDLIDRAIFIQKGKIVQIFSGGMSFVIFQMSSVSVWGLEVLSILYWELPSRRSARSAGRLIRRKIFPVPLISSRYSAASAFSAKRGEVLGIVGHKRRRKNDDDHAACAGF